MLGEIWLNNPQQKHVTTQRENKIDSLRGLRGLNGFNMYILKTGNKEKFRFNSLDL